LATDDKLVAYLNPFKTSKVMMKAVYRITINGRVFYQETTGLRTSLCISVTASQSLKGA